jgi:hypothetical protein
MDAASEFASSGDGTALADDAAVDSREDESGAGSAAPEVGDDDGPIEAPLEAGAERGDASGSADAGAPDSTDAGAGSDGSWPSVLDLEGFWEGKTSQGLDLSFVVLAPGIQEWTFGWQVPACGTGSSVHVMHPQPVPIIDGRAMRTQPGGPGGITATVTIVFESKTLATGTLDYTLNPFPVGPSCSGHVTATFEAHLRP